MRASLTRMISPSSLSAFSATNGVAPSGGVQAPAAPPPVQQARAQAPSPPVQAGSQGFGPSGTPTAPPPGQNTPRGSLLNLIV
jgi:hypothetical protein